MFLNYSCQSQDKRLPQYKGERIPPYKPLSFSCHREGGQRPTVAISLFKGLRLSQSNKWEKISLIIPKKTRTKKTRTKKTRTKRTRTTYGVRLKDLKLKAKKKKIKKQRPLGRKDFPV